MKRRVVSLVTALALCLSLCPAWALAADVEPDNLDPIENPIGEQTGDQAEDQPGESLTADGDSTDGDSSSGGQTGGEQDPDPGSDPQPEGSDPQPEGSDPGSDSQPEEPQPAEWKKNFLTGDWPVKNPYIVSKLVILDMRGFSITASASSAIQVKGTAMLSLIGTGTITSQKGAGIEVLSGGTLYIDGQDSSLVITGSTVGLDVADGASAQLSGGTFTGTQAAIQTGDNDFSKLLKPGFTYFDTSGKPIALANVAAAKTVVIQACTDHLDKSYVPNSGTATHTWTCRACKTAEVEPCTFTFKDTGTGTCDDCGNVVTIAVDEDSLKALAYDETIKPGNGTVTVTPENGTALPDTDYTVSYETRAVTGSTNITVTVTVVGKAYTGIFTQEFTFTKEDLSGPVLKWNDTRPITVPYTGETVAVSSLPSITINIDSANDLKQYLQYSYSEGGGAYQDGLPKNVGTYQVVATLPEAPVKVAGYQAASTEPITLTITAIDPVKTPPAAKELVYNENEQELVTPGVLDPVAAADGAEILFATSKDGVYSAAIPVGVNAKTYEVWYKVEATGNCKAVEAKKIDDVKIQPKSIVPTILVRDTSYVYDSSKKEPEITVRDGQTVLQDDQYTIAWDNDRTNVGRHTLTVQDKAGANYTFKEPNTATITIEPAIQTGLSITGQPARVCYGDRITTLKTLGGSGEGTVSWSITAPETHSSTINPTTGELVVKDTGSITVKAERVVLNHQTVTDTWTFTVEPKQVTAVVTITSKAYDGTNSINPGDIKAEVNGNDLVDAADSFTITGLTGTYGNASVGTNKPVTLSDSGMSGTWDTAKYTVTCPQTAAADITPRVVTVEVTLSGNDLKPDANGKYSYTYDGTERTPAVAVKGWDAGGYDAQLTTDDYSVNYANNKNAGTATVTVSRKTGGNYTFPDKKVEFTIESADAELKRSPEARNLTYTGAAQELVTVGEAAGGHVEYSLDKDRGYSPNVPEKKDAGTYTVYYKVVGDSNHDGPAPSGSVSVTIKQKELISPDVTVGGTYTYNGVAITPDKEKVTVRDDTNTEIPRSEYNVRYCDNDKAGTATVVVTNAIGGNYIVNGEGTFEIGKGTASVENGPAGQNLPYNNTAQELVKAGTAATGTMVYSLKKEGPYSPFIPTATEIGDYTIWYKAQGDSDYEDSVPDSVPASIVVNDVTKPTIQVKPGQVKYNGEKQVPEITVRDDNGDLIDSGEYDVTYADASNNGNDDLTQAGTYTITITNKANSNYKITDTSKTFTILRADQNPMVINGTRENVSYGDNIQLSTTGGSGTGEVTWKSSDTAIAEISKTGLLTITGVGSVTVTATRKADGYNEQAATWSFYADKKQVTAFVSAESKTFDGRTDTKVTATIPASELVNASDVITIEGLTGKFSDSSAGPDKKVKVDRTAVRLEGKDSGKYVVVYPDETTASILKAEIGANDVTAPTAAGPLEYNGSAQNLIQPGFSKYGTLKYSLDNVTYFEGIPTGTDAKDYRVWYRVEGDENHNDTEAVELTKSAPITIAKQKLEKPQIEFIPSGASYDDMVHKPAVKITDKYNHEITASEYEVTYDPDTNWKDAGEHKVIIKSVESGNYEINVTATFKIDPAGQNPLSITGMPSEVHYGDIFRLSAIGGSGNGAIHWKSTNTDIATVSVNGEVTVVGVGPFDIEAYREGEDDNYSQSNTDIQPFNAKKKSITPVVTAEDKSYDGTKEATLTAVWKDGDLVGADEVKITVIKGEFETADAGPGKKVKITEKSVGGKDAEKYEIKWPESTTASIYKVTANLDHPPEPLPLKYNGGLQKLVAEGATVHNIGTIKYSLDQNGVYTEAVPEAAEVGTHTVWFKVEGTTNHTGIGAASVDVTISKGEPELVTPYTLTAAAGTKLNEISLDGIRAKVGENFVVSGTFAWVKGEDTFSGEASEYEVRFTPDDETRYVPVTLNVQVKPVSSDPAPGGESSTTNTTTSPSTTPNTNVPSVSTPMQTSVRDGAATTVLSASAGSELVREAVASKSQNVVIKPEITGSVTKSTVSIPSTTVSQINRATSANLTVSTPVADVTIPNTALSTLSSAGGTVDVVTEQKDQTVAVTLTAGGETVENLPGGLTLAVPVEDAAPGTVAMLVNEDGSRETLRKSVVEDGTLSIPLSGSATVEIVDNSKDFADVPDTSWAADAVAFASAHELFNGTSETTFSPEESMSRAMLATVLYNLEGRPEQSLTSEFNDVNSDDWYAESVAWTTANGITNGYGDGGFGPDDNVTREQFAVMLWKYAGSPEAAVEDLSFTDADQASDYAVEALCWAAAKGILNGYEDGSLNPGGLATRAEAAQILKNFLENV